MTGSDHALYAATARLLQASFVPSAWALALATVSMAVLALAGHSLPLLPSLGFAAASLLGLPERYLAFRLRLDAGLFSDLAQERIASLDVLDAALQHLGLRKLPGNTPRLLQDRLTGTRQLLQRHAVLVVCQSVFFALALVALHWR